MRSAIIALLFAGAARAESLAVLELRSRLPEAERGTVDATYLTDRIRAAALEAAPHLRVMTRENVVVLLKSLGRTLEDCEGECEVETGRKLGADYVLSGELLHYGQGLKASLRLHDARDGRLVSAQVASGTNADALDASLGQVVPKLFANLAEKPQKLVSQEPTREEREAQRGQTIAQRIGSGLAFEARVMLPLVANFEPTGGLLDFQRSDGLYAGIIGAGVRIGGVHWFDSSLGLRYGGGIDVRLSHLRETYEIGNGAGGFDLTSVESNERLISVPAHLGLLLPLGRTTLGLSWVPAFVHRTSSNSSGSNAPYSLRFLCFEAHAEFGFSADPNAKQARLKLYVEAQPQVGLKSKDEYVAYGAAGVGLSWY